MGSNTVSVIDTATNNVTATVPVGDYPLGVAVNLEGTKVYVANEESNTVSVIDTATNKVIATVPVGKDPVAFGQFIGSVPVQSPNTSCCKLRGIASLRKSTIKCHIYGHQHRLANCMEMEFWRRNNFNS